MKVIPGGEVLSQNHLLGMDFLIKREVKAKEKFKREMILWKLKEAKVFMEPCDENHSLSEFRRNCELKKFLKKL